MMMSSSAQLSELPSPEEKKEDSETPHPKSCSPPSSEKQQKEPISSQKPSKISLLATTYNQELDRLLEEWLCSWLDTQIPLPSLPSIDSAHQDSKPAPSLPRKSSQEWSISELDQEYNQCHFMTWTALSTLITFQNKSSNTKKPELASPIWDRLHKM